MLAIVYSILDMEGGGGEGGGIQTCTPPNKRLRFGAIFCIVFLDTGRETRETGSGVDGEGEEET